MIVTILILRRMIRIRRRGRIKLRRTLRIIIIRGKLLRRILGIPRRIKVINNDRTTNIAKKNYNNKTSIIITRRGRE